MKVLFITITYPLPGQRNIYADLMWEFKRNGHEVFVACSTKGKEGEKTAITGQDDISVLRIKTDNLIGQKNLIKKGLSMLTLDGIFVKAIKAYYKDIRFDLVLYSTPPITLTQAIKYVKKRDKALTYLLLKDIFPQNAVDIGLMRKGGIIYRYFRKKEKELYSISDKIGCMSQANVEFVLKNNPQISSEKVEVCPNSIALSERFAVNKLAVKEKHGIPEGVPVFIYGGSIGKPQGVDYFLRCLESNCNLSDRYFVVCGRGTEYKKVETFFARFKPDNMLLINYLPKDDYDELVSACDVGLIFLDYRFTIPNFPSRILSYMEYSMPVLAATDVNTDVKDVITENKIGYWCESRDETEFKKLVDKICVEKNRLPIMGANARKYLEENYDVSISYEIIVNHFSHFDG